MALRSTSYLRSVVSRLRSGAAASYATSTQPKMKPYAPATGGTQNEKRFFKLPARGDFVPVYVALGMIALSVSLGLYTAKQEISYSPNVRVKKKDRETIPEVVDPDKVVDEADKFVKKSFFRKVAHVQEFDGGHHQNTADPIRKDAFAYPPKVETLKSVGIDPKQL